MSHFQHAGATHEFIKNDDFVMNYKYDYLVFIGRFQPFHLAHMQTIQIALKESRYVILALGSAQNERNIKNPFTVDEREEMILSNFSAEHQKRIKFVPVIDVYDDVKWQTLVKSLVSDITQLTDHIGLIGHFKDDSSYYLKFFPEWEMVELDSLQGSMSATPMREAYYRGEIIEAAFPLGTRDFLQKFKETPLYLQLQHKFLTEDKSNLS